MLHGHATSAKEKSEGIGIGLPGMLDAGRKRVLRMPNFPRWKDFDLKVEAERLLEAPVVI